MAAASGIGREIEGIPFCLLDFDLQNNVPAGTIGDIARMRVGELAVSLLGFEPNR